MFALKCMGLGEFTEAGLENNNKFYAKVKCCTIDYQELQNGFTDSQFDGFTVLQFCCLQFGGVTLLQFKRVTSHRQNWLLCPVFT